MLCNLQHGQRLAILVLRNEYRQAAAIGAAESDQTVERSDAGRCRARGCASFRPKGRRRRYRFHRFERDIVANDFGLARPFEHPKSARVLRSLVVRGTTAADSPGPFT